MFTVVTDSSVIADFITSKSFFPGLIETYHNDCCPLRRSESGTKNP